MLRWIIRLPAKADISTGAGRPSSIVAPESANNNSAKKKCRRRPAAAAPPSRPVQVGLRQSALESAPPRARVTTESMINAIDDDDAAAALAMVPAPVEGREVPGHRQRHRRTEPE